MSILVKSSKPGQDVLTCGIENLNFTSSKDLFKLYDYGSWEIELTGGWAFDTLEIPHDLGYYPGFSVVGEVPTDLGGTVGRYTKYVWSFTYGARVDTEDLIITATSDNVQTIHGYYIIYLDPLEE